MFDTVILSRKIHNLAEFLPALLPLETAVNPWPESENAEF
jgi:hypothetical protein